MATVKTRRNLAKAGVLTGLVIGALFAGLPVLWMLSTSFKANGEVFQTPPRLITKGFSFDAYREIFGNVFRYAVVMMIAYGSVNTMCVTIRPG